MEDNRVDRELRDAVIHVIKCSLHNQKVEPGFFDRFDSEEMLKIFKAHQLSALASLAVDLPDEKWKREAFFALRKTILFDEERKEITHFLEENGIWYCPLKGIVLKDLYPQYGTREMSDNDILVDANKMEEISLFMKERGYDSILKNKSNHDVYYKKPIFNFEFHHALFNKSTGKQFVGYYNDIKKKLTKDNNSAYGYHLSNEDFYIYLISHCYKHLSSGGIGLRSLVDIFLFIKKHNDLDWDYIDSQIILLDIVKEEKEIRNLVSKLFEKNGDGLNKEENDLLDYISNSGAHGTKRNVIINGLNRAKRGGNYKLRYVFRRIVLNDEDLEEYFPFFYKNKWALPGLIIYRGMKAIFTGPGRLLREIKMVITEGNENGRI